MHAEAVETQSVQTVYGTFVGYKDDEITQQLTRYSAHTRNELSMLLSFVAPGMVVIDVGAHIGTFTVPIGLRVGCQGKVHSFEANKTTFELLSRNIDANELTSIVEPHNTIVSNTNGRFAKSVGANSGTACFLPVTGGDAQTVNTRVLRLDDWYFSGNGERGPVHVLKIDTEGAEIEVLKTCERLLREYRPVVYCEVNRQALSRFGARPTDIESFLRTHGYHFFCNVGKRNSSDDTYSLARLRNLRHAGAFYDVLAVHPDDKRYPRRYRPSPWADIARVRRRFLYLSHRLGSAFSGKHVS